MHSKYRISRTFKLEELPEFRRFQEANPGHKIDARQTALMYGRAIHWLSIFEVLWPDFEGRDYYRVEVAYIVVNDPDDKLLPPEFYSQIAQILATFWKIQLEDLYPAGDWSVTIQSDPEITVDAYIRRRERA